MLKLLLAGVFWLMSVSVVLASDVVINEIYANPPGSTEETEFVELYNRGDNPVDLSGYKIADLVKEYTISEATISGHGFLSFRKELTGIQLNNGGDTVYFKDTADAEIDTHEYFSTEEEKSISRIPDGHGEFVGGTEVTEAAANQAPPSPEPSPSPSPSPSPESEAESSPSPTPAASSKASVKPTGAAVSNSDSHDSDEMLLSTEGGRILGIDEPETFEASESQKKKNPFLVSIVLGGLGLGLLGGTGVVFYKQQRYNEKHGKDDKRKKA